MYVSKIFVAEKTPKKQITKPWNDVPHSFQTLSGGLVWPTCLADLSGRLVWPTCLADLSGGLVWRTCLVDLSGGLVWPTCLADLSGGLVWLNCSLIPRTSGRPPVKKEEGLVNIVPHHAIG